MLLRHLLVCLALTSFSSAQGKLWIVDQAQGPGFDHVDIPAALQSARPGDTILVRKGNYSGFWLNRQMSVVAQPGVTCKKGSGLVEVSYVPAGERAVVRGLHSSSSSMRILNNRGQVVLEDCAGPFNISASHNVQAHATIGDFYLDDATLVAVDCVSGTHIHGAWLKRSHMTIAGGSYRGGNWYGAAHAAALVDKDSTLVVTGDANTSLVATPHSRYQAPAIAGTGKLILDPRVTLKGSNPSAALLGITSVTRRTIPYLRAQSAAIGGTVQVSMQAGAGDAYLLALGLPGVRQPFPGLSGDIWLNLATTSVVAGGQLDAQGRRGWSVPVPRDPILIGFSVMWQGTAGPSAAAQTLSNPVTYVHDL